MNASVLRFVPIPILLLFAWLPLRSQGPDVRVSPEPVSYQLPPDAQIQSAASIGDVTLAAWGTTVPLTGISTANAVFMRLLWRHVPMKQSGFVHGASARPYGLVQVIPARDRFLVFWNDRRADSPGVYLRVVDTNGGFIGDERKFADGRISQAGIFRFPLGNGYRLIYNIITEKDSGYCSLFMTGDGRFPGFQVGPFAGMIHELRNIPGYSGMALLMRGDSTPVLIDANGRLSYPDRFFADNLKRPHYFNEDGSFAVLKDDTLRIFRTIFDAVPAQWRHVPLHGYLQDGEMLSRSDGGAYVIHAFHYSFRDDGQGDLSVARIIQQSDSFVVVGSMVLTYIGNPDHHITHWINRISMERWWGCDNTSGLELDADVGTRLRSGGYDTTLSVHYSSYIGLDKHGYIIPNLPLDCSSECNPAALRKYDRTLSAIAVIVSDDTVYLSVGRAGFKSDSAQVNPAICSIGEKLLVNWYSRQSMPEYLLGEWIPGGESHAEILSELEPTGFQDTASVQAAGTYDRGVNIIGQSDRGCMVTSARRWAEYTRRYDAETVFRHQLSAYVATPEGWKSALHLAPDNLGFEGFNLISQGYNPNRDEWVTLMTTWIYVNYWTAVPVVHIYAIDTDGRNGWAIDSAINRIDPKAVIIPVDSAEYFSVTGTAATHWRGKDSVGAITFATSYPRAVYRRLLGPYFLRSYFATENSGSSTLTLELYDLNGTLRRSREIHYTGVRNEPVLVQNGNDSSIAVLRGDSSGVRLDMVDRLLNPRVTDLPVSTTRGAVRHPAGIFRGDTLYLVWEDDRDGASNIYGNYLPVPRLSAGVHEEWEVGGELALSLEPNPSTGTARLRIFHPVSAVTIVVADMLGNIVRRYSSDHLDSGIMTLPVNLDGLPSGIYAVSVESGGKRGTGRLIIGR
ncbi:MAG: hypothetical protein JWQ98_636 [Chlorobi bacterium]|nr:hypothetical protein [Chlorobiota bacterium]